MSYLILSDYFKMIQAKNLDQVIGSNTDNRTNAELAAQAECVSHLIQKYDTSKEFTDTLLYDPASAAYKAASRVYLDAPAYSATAAYAVGSLALQAGSVYINTTIISAPGEAFTPSHWALLGLQYQIFFAQYPKPLFDLKNGRYAVGDIVFYKDHRYNCLQATRVFDSSTLLQFGEYENVPYGNVFPDQPYQQSWQDLGAYSIPAGSLLNPTYFTKGDNRNQQMVMFLVDIALYHVHSRISSMNVPELRHDRYRAAIKWLKECAEGNVTADLIKIQPPQGMRIRAGGNIKAKNGY